MCYVHAESEEKPGRNPQTARRKEDDNMSRVDQFSSFQQIVTMVNADSATFISNASGGKAINTVRKGPTLVREKKIRANGGASTAVDILS